ncbi:MAG: NRAMP family divalent metal transporter [Gemmatimonadales bacterium]|nr:NRAMP family divalent metal transporter [Gemmatimonadales bacterium]
MTSRARSAGFGAAFLMATSAIGPGFLTQTAVFTNQLGPSFGFAILLSVLFDLAAQVTIWRVLVGSGQRAQAVANAVLPGLGAALGLAVAAGGLAFNIGNVAGAGLGLNVLLGIDARVGALLSAVVGIGIFLVRDAGRDMDRFAQVLGGLMVVIALIVAVVAAPPIGEALVRSVVPTRIDPLAIVTIVGGTVGGYITFAGAHRLLDAGVTGPAEVAGATRSALLGVSVATVMRVVLFLGALGVVASGRVLDPANPPASVFRLAAGELGYRFFGLVMWAAAVTSVVGSAYTSVSFLDGLARRSAAVGDPRRRTTGIIAFIAISTAVFLTIGRPVTILVVVGAINGLILPIGLTAVLLAARRDPYRTAARLPRWLVAAAVLVTGAMTVLGGYTLVTQVPPLFGR